MRSSLLLAPSAREIELLDVQTPDNIEALMNCGQSVPCHGSQRRTTARLQPSGEQSEAECLPYAVTEPDLVVAVGLFDIPDPHFAHPTEHDVVRQQVLRW